MMMMMIYIYMSLGAKGLIEARALFSTLVTQLLPLLDSLSICDRQYFASALGIDDTQ